MSNFLKRTKRASEEIAYDAIHEKAKEQHYYPGISYQRLFDAIHEAGPTPTISQMTDIIHVVKTDFFDDKTEIIRLQNVGISLANDIEQKRKEIESLKEQLAIASEQVPKGAFEFNHLEK